MVTDLASGSFNYNAGSPAQTRADSISNYYLTNSNDFGGSVAGFFQRLVDPNYADKRAEWQASQSSADAEYSANRNRLWQDYMYEKNRAFASDLYEKNRAFTERMSNTAYQRAVKDMKAAGINPLMAIHLGGASTPTLSIPTLSTGSGSSASTHLPNKGDDNSILGALAGEIIKMLAGYVMQGVSNSFGVGSIGFGG